MNKTQIIMLLVAVVMVLGMYMLPTTAPDRKGIDEKRSMRMETMDKGSLLRRANEKYKPTELAEVLQLNDMASATKSDTAKIGWLERLSGAWFRLGEPALAGVYAQEIAEIRNDEGSWAITGTTYAYGIRTYGEQDIRQFCQGRAVRALENAISINPESSQHRINLALCYVDMPLEDNPMKGILMLRDMLEKHPDDVAVLTQLGALAIRTGQYGKALERLGKAQQLAPEDPQVLRLLVAAYRGAGNEEEARRYEKELGN